jgi:pyridoxal phosphate enzyme (YggS family)
MPAFDTADGLSRVRERIATACHRCGRDTDDVQLVAVCKRIPLARVVAACRAGQWDLGENRLQEALPRQQELSELLRRAELPADRVQWHFIGHLQTNKAKKAVGRFALLQAVDSMRQVDLLQSRAAELGIRQPLLIEVNLSGEAQKYGCRPEGTVELLEHIAACPDLEPQGLMTMASFGAAAEALRRTFAGLRRLAEQAARDTGLALPHLSMGMSDDFEIAIAEGATIVRIGTAIFGPRD